MEYGPSAREVGIAPTQEKKSAKHKGRRFFHRTKRVVVQEPVGETPHFATARELHQTRGYQEHTIKEIMKRPKKRKAEAIEQAAQPAVPVVEKPTERPLPAPEAPREQPRPFMELQIHPEGIQYVQPEHHLPTVEEIAAMDRHGKPRKIEQAQDFLHKTGEFAKATAENIKWGIGRITRGNIVDRLKQMHQDPAAYQAELQAELQRAIVDVIKPEDPNFVSRHRKDFVQGAATVSTLFLVPVPTPFLPFEPFRTLGSLIITGLDAYNTAIAFKEMRFRKAMTYSAMTAATLLTGFIPGAHNLTNTWYTELLQKSFDHAESEGMLTVVGSLFQPGSNADRRKLGYHMVNQAVVSSYDQTGQVLFQEDQLAAARARLTAKKEDLLAQQQAIQDAHEELPSMMESLRHPSTIWKNMSSYLGLLSQSVNLSQEFSDVDHKLHTLPQLENIFKGAREHYETLSA